MRIELTPDDCRALCGHFVPFSARIGHIQCRRGENVQDARSALARHLVDGMIALGCAIDLNDPGIPGLYIGALIRQTILAALSFDRRQPGTLALEIRARFESLLGGLDDFISTPIVDRLGTLGPACPG